MLTLVCRNGKVFKKYRKQWRKYVEAGIPQLKKWRREISKEYPGILPKEKNWFRLAEKEILAAALRLGCGNVWIEL